MSKEEQNESEKMKKIIQDWRLSKKYQEMHEEFKLKKKILSDVKNLNKEELNKHFNDNYLEKNQLLEIIETNIEFDNARDKGKEGLDWIIENIAYVTDKQEAYQDYIKTQVTWYHYLFLHQTLEDYELCAKIKRCIAIEKEYFINTLKYYLTYDDGDKLFVEEIERDIYNILFK